MVNEGSVVIYDTASEQEVRRGWGSGRCTTRGRCAAKCNAAAGVVFSGQDPPPRGSMEPVVTPGDRPHLMHRAQVRRIAVPGVVAIALSPKATHLITLSRPNKEEGNAAKNLKVRAPKGRARPWWRVAQRCLRSWPRKREVPDTPALRPGRHLTGNGLNSIQSRLHAEPS